MLSKCTMILIFSRN